MTVEKLAEILSRVDNKKRKVYMEAYSLNEVNGYYYTRKDGEDAVVFSTLYVQPRVEDDV